LKRVLHKKKWLREKRAAAKARQEAVAAEKEVRKRALLQSDRYGAEGAPEISHKKLEHLSRSKAERLRPVWQPKKKYKLKPLRRNLDNILTEDEDEDFKARRTRAYNEEPTNTTSTKFRKARLKQTKMDKK